MEGKYFCFNPNACFFYGEGKYIGVKESWKKGVNNPIPYLGDIHKRLRQGEGLRGQNLLISRSKKLPTHGRGM